MTFPSNYTLHYIYILSKIAPKNCYYTGGMMTHSRTPQMMRPILPLFEKSKALLHRQRRSPIPTEIFARVCTCYKHCMTVSIKSCEICSVRCWSREKTRFSIPVQNICQKESNTYLMGSLEHYSDLFSPWSIVYLSNIAWCIDSRFKSIYSIYGPRRSP